MEFCLYDCNRSSAVKGMSSVFSGCNNVVDEYCNNVFVFEIVFFLCEFDVICISKFVVFIVYVFINEFMDEKNFLKLSAS